MNIEDRNSEFSTQQHQMNAEGSTDEKPLYKEVFKYVLGRGYIATSISVWYDELQSVWRWVCDLSNPAEFGLVAQEKYDKVTQENEQLKTIIDQFKKMRSGIENLQILQLQQQNEQLKAELKVTEDSLAIAQAENNDNQLQQLREAVKDLYEGYLLSNSSEVSAILAKHSELRGSITNQ